MAEEKIQETDDGYYVQSGDILEWKWKKDEPEARKAEPKKVTTKTAEPLVKKAAKK